MSRVKLTLFACLAALCLAVVAAPGAFASTGKVQTSAGGNPAGTTFTGATTGTVTLQQKGGAKITCTKGTGKGEITSETAGTGEEVYEGCVASTGGKCQTEEVEGKEGIIKTGAVNLQLWTSESGAGKDLVAVKFTKNIVFKCKGVTETVKQNSSDEAAFLATVTTEGTASTTNTFTATQSAGLQSPLTGFPPGATTAKSTEIESEIGGTGFLQSGLGGALKVTFSQSVKFV
jgi:hypothetical protein